jgi:ribosomal protein S7
MLEAHCIAAVHPRSVAHAAQTGAKVIQVIKRPLDALAPLADDESRMLAGRVYAEGRDSPDTTCSQMT